MKKEIIINKNAPFDYNTDVVLVPGDAQAYKIVYKTPYDLTGAILTVTAMRAGRENVVDMGTCEGDTAYYTLKNNMYNEEGYISIRLTLTSAIGEKLTERQLRFKVAENWGEANISGDDRLPALDALIIQVTELKNDVNQALEQVNDATGEIQGHINDGGIHVTAEEKTTWNNKLDERKDDFNCVYATDDNGGLVMLPAQGGVIGMKVALCDQQGRLSTNDPEYETDAVNKRAMEAALNRKISNLVDGNRDGAVRGVGAESDHLMGEYAAAFGYDTEARGYCSHAEGSDTTAGGDLSHAEGDYTRANGYCSHAEGSETRANGDYSHAAGYYTIAKYNQTVIGRHNVESTASNDNYDSSKEALIIGNGNHSSRSNAFVVFYNGLIDIYNDIRVKTSGLLQTAAQTIIGAINEIKALVDNKLDKDTDIDMTDHKITDLADAESAKDAVNRQNAANPFTGTKSGKRITLTDVQKGTDANRLDIKGETKEIGEGEKSPDNPYELVGVENATVHISDGESVQQTIPLTFEQPLYSLPNGVRDEVDLESGEGERKTIELVFDGSGDEPWYDYTDVPDFVGFYSNVLPITGSTSESTPHAASNWLEWKPYATAVLKDRNAFYVAEGGRVFLNIARSIIGATSDEPLESARVKLRAYLATNPLIVLAQRTTPEPFTITPLTIPTYSPSTIISTDNGSLEVEYNRDSNTVIADLQAAIIALGGNI